MGTKAIDNRIKKLKEIEAQQKALEEQAEKLKDEINYFRQKSTVLIYHMIYSFSPYR